MERLCGLAVILRGQLFQPFLNVFNALLDVSAQTIDDRLISDNRHTNYFTITFEVLVVIR